MALVLALGALGVGYAAWTDQVTIAGTVTTGTLSLDVIGYSGTQVFKMDDGRSHVVDWENETGIPPEWPTGAIQLVGHSGARPGIDDERDVVVWFENLFPCVEFKANVVLHCTGSVPIHVKAGLKALDEESEKLAMEILAGPEGVLKGEGYLSQDDGTTWTLVDLNTFTQMHHCERLKIVGVIKLPQADELMGRKGSFEVDINAIQYNKEADYDTYFPGPYHSP